MQRYFVPFRDEVFLMAKEICKEKYSCLLKKDYSVVKGILEREIYEFYRVF